MEPERPKYIAPADPSVRIYTERVLNWFSQTGSGVSRGKHGGHLASAATQAGCSV